MYEVLQTGVHVAFTGVLYLEFLCLFSFVCLSVPFPLFKAFLFPFFFFQGDTLLRTKQHGLAWSMSRRAFLVYFSVSYIMKDQFWISTLIQRLTKKIM
jgi:hypothetical protein